MTTMLLAVGSTWLRRACEGVLGTLGHAVLPVDRPLAPLSLSGLVAWDAAVIDASELGRGTLDALALTLRRPIVGIGIEAPAIARSIQLPLQEGELASALESLLFAAETPELPLHLDAGRSVVMVNGRREHLTRTEFRLLQLLFDARPSDVPLSEVLVAVWGSTEGEATSELVRAHLRNLRRKLASLGLTDVVRSRRGLGYSLHL